MVGSSVGSAVHMGRRARDGHRRPRSAVCGYWYRSATGTAKRIAVLAVAEGSAPAAPVRRRARLPARLYTLWGRSVRAWSIACLEVQKRTLHTYCKEALLVHTSCSACMHGARWNGDRFRVSGCTNGSDPAPLPLSTQVLSCGVFSVDSSGTPVLWADPVASLLHSHVVAASGAFASRVAP